MCRWSRFPRWIRDVFQRNFTENPRDFIVEDGVLTKYTGSGGNIVIPKNIIEIGEGAFWSCASLQSVTIPETVAKLGWKAFFGCVNLQSITIPADLEKISRQAFDR